MNHYARIVATGMAVPQRVIPNSWFDEILGENVSTWLEENLTIRERRWLGENESTADLATAAAKDILKNAGVRPSEIDLLIISTDTPEYISPSTASVVQHRLGLVKAGTFDINTACAGFVTALDMGAKYIAADAQYQNVLVIGAYAMSKYLDLADKKTVTLFADGAAGVLLRADTQHPGFFTGKLHTEGKYHGWMGIYAGGTHQPVSTKVLYAGDHQLRFVRKFPKEINPLTWERMVRETIGAAGYQVSNIDMAFFTQININSIRETMAALGLSLEKTHTVMDRYAYTGSACIPMALHEANQQGKLKTGDLTVFMGSGGGLAFACAAFLW